MRPFSLGERLLACAEFVRADAYIADIGSDHGLLPVYLSKNGQISGGVASDISSSAIKSAQRNIKKHNLQNIKTVAADGLSGVDSKLTDDIIIAGMGGEVIADILSDVPFIRSKKYRFILQPMSRPEKLRSFLFENKFEILDEKCVTDAGRLYVIIHAAFSGNDKNYTYFDTYTGGLTRHINDEHTRNYLLRQARIIRNEGLGLAKGNLTQKAQTLLHLAEKIENLVHQAAGKDLNSD